VRFDGSTQLLATNKSITLEGVSNEEINKHKIANTAILLLLSSYELLVTTDFETLSLISEYCKLAMLNLKIEFDEGAR
jgi:hypothetical protein